MLEGIIGKILSVLGSGLLSSITIYPTSIYMQLAVFYLAHKGMIFLILPLIMTYEGLAGMKGLISINTLHKT